MIYIFFTVKIACSCINLCSMVSVVFFFFSLFDVKEVCIEELLQSSCCLLMISSFDSCGKSCVCLIIVFHCAFTQVSLFLVFFQVTDCKHEYHLQCILEWYIQNLLLYNILIKYWEYSVHPLLHIFNHHFLG